MIRSLYFDDPDDSCLYEIAAGVDLRSKYRIRYYGDDTGRISLEKKAKRSNLMLKRISLLTKEEAQLLCAGRYLRDCASLDPLKKEMTWKIMAKGFRPAVIVEYERIPYVFAAGNVRITFDTNIRSSNDTADFLGDYSYTRPVLPSGRMILEVKYDEFLPALIYDCINITDLQQLSISKYALCRRYENMNGGM